ncbi:MAG: HPr kinase/phosphorylase [Planktomarina sp.]
MLHASAVCFDGRALLIGGSSGSGKSGLALNLISLGAMLISDDRVWIEWHEDEVVVKTPTAIEGQIEARGVGLITMPFLSNQSLDFCVNLSGSSDQRLPVPRTVTLLGREFPEFLGGGTPNLAAALMCLLSGGVCYAD